MKKRILFLMLILLSVKLNAQFLKHCLPEGSKLLQQYQRRIIGKDWKEGGKICFIFKPTKSEEKIAKRVLATSFESGRKKWKKLEKAEAELAQAHQTKDLQSTTSALAALQDATKIYNLAIKAYILNKNRVGYELDRTESGKRCFFFPITTLYHRFGRLACQGDRALRLVTAHCGPKPLSTIGSYQDPLDEDKRCWVSLS